MDMDYLVKSGYLISSSKAWRIYVTSGVKFVPSNWTLIMVNEVECLRCTFDNGFEIGIGGPR